MYFCIHLMPPLAYAKIRKEIKRTMKKHINNYILAAFAAILVFVCIRSIYAPVHFDGERGEGAGGKVAPYCDKAGSGGKPQADGHVQRKFRGADDARTAG